MHTAVATVTPTPPPVPPDPGDTDDNVVPVSVSISRASTSPVSTRNDDNHNSSAVKDSDTECVVTNHSSVDKLQHVSHDSHPSHDQKSTDNQSPHQQPPSTSPSVDDDATSVDHPAVVKISVSVPRDAVGFIIGKRGETVRNMMTKSGAFVAVDREDTNPHAPYRLFHIEGDKSCVNAARALIKEKVAAVLHGKPHARVVNAKLHTQTHTSSQAAGQGGTDILALDPDDTDDDTPLSEPLEMWIPRGCVGMIIGHGGQVINEMQERAGATIVVHNNRMDGHGSKLLTISGGEREKQHAQELIQSILDRAGLRNRFNDNPSQHHDPQWGLIPSQPTHLQGHPGPPWFLPPGNPQLPFDPRGQIPELLRYPHPIHQWIHPIAMPPRHSPHHQQPVPGVVAQPQGPTQSQALQTESQPRHQNHQPATPTSPATPQQQQLQQQLQQQMQHMQQIQHHNKQQQHPPQPSQAHQLHHQQQPQSQPPPQQQQQPPPQQQQQPQQPQPQPQPQQAAQLSQAQLHNQAPPQHQGQSPQIPRGPGIAGAHLTPQVNPMYARTINPTAQHIPWNPAQIPYPLGQNIQVPFDQGNIISPHPMVDFARKAVNVPSSCVGIVIGRSGETIRDLQQRSGAHIKVTPDRDAKDDDPLRIIYITGTHAAVELAHTLINDVINEGLTRSYRDGVEPRSNADQPESHGQEIQEQEKGKRGRTEEDSIRSTNEKSKNAKNRSSGEDQCQDVGDTIDYNDSTKFPELGAAARDTKSKRQVESDKTGRDESDETKIAPVNQAWTGSEGGNADFKGQIANHAGRESDSPPVPFTGEGRLVQRPATNYPSASISYEMKIPHAKVGVIIGKRGSTIRLLQQKSGARIVVSKKIDTSREDNPRAVTITGPEPFVDTARRLIIAKISDPSRADDKDLGLDTLEMDDALLSEDTGVDSLTMDMANHSINSPLPPMMSANTTPISPMRMPQTPGYGPYHNPVPMVGPNPPIPFSGVPPPYANIRGIMRREGPDFGSMEPQAHHQQGQFPPHLLGLQQLAERIHVAQPFPFQQSVEGGDSLQAGFGEYRPEQYYQHGGGNFVGLPSDGATNFQAEAATQMGQAAAAQVAPEYSRDEAAYACDVDEYDAQDNDAASAA